MKLIGLSGKARSGKDAVADMCCQVYGWHKYKLADSLKAMCRNAFNLTRQQTDGELKDVVAQRYGVAPRQIMIEFGKMCRGFDANFWINEMVQEMLLVPQAQLRTFVIADVRFPNEVEWIKAHNGIVIRLERDVELRGSDIPDYSETALDAYGGFDLVVQAEHNIDSADLPVIASRIKSVLDKRKAA
jgi:hypothetical protein